MDKNTFIESFKEVLDGSEKINQIAENTANIKRLITNNGASFAAGLEISFTSPQRDVVIKNDGANDIILYVIDTTKESVVAADTASGQKVINVTAGHGTKFVAGDTIVIGADTAREEIAVVDTVAANTVTVVSNLTYPHTAVQADKVQKYFNKHTVRPINISPENGYFDEPFWDFQKIIISRGQAQNTIAGRYYTRYGV